jgi:hypothetical protein
VCKGWLTCSGGDCLNPFELDPATSVTICERAEEGGDERSQRDWCYWYAAYHKDDLAFCEQMEWATARAKCLDGEDPASYLIIPGF